MVGRSVVLRIDGEWVSGSLDTSSSVGSTCSNYDEASFQCLRHRLEGTESMCVRGFDSHMGLSRDPNDWPLNERDRGALKTLRPCRFAGSFANRVWFLPAFRRQNEIQFHGDRVLCRALRLFG